MTNYDHNSLYEAFKEEKNWTDIYFIIMYHNYFGEFQILTKKKFNVCEGPMSPSYPK